MQSIESAIPLLRCPFNTGIPVRHEDGMLVSADDAHHFPLTSSNIPLFAQTPDTPDAARQQDHYNRVAAKYAENLTYPHTIEYMDYLDRALFSAVGDRPLGIMAEICCGLGEAVTLLNGRFTQAVGVDISSSMLERGLQRNQNVRSVTLVQGDATSLPLADQSFDTVCMLGGIHHVNNRKRLFSEIFRILKPGGYFYFREPCSDFFLWRALRYVVYRVSPALDHETERPLLYEETVPLLTEAGFETKAYRTYGFLGFCFFMNSDVLVFNRLLRFLPGIRWLTRMAAKTDDLVTRLPGLHKAGLQVVGVARKPG